MARKRPRILQIRQTNLPAAIAEAVDCLRRGGLVVIPTDTVYGVAGHPAVAGIEESIYRAKERDRGVATKERSKSARPPRFKVILYNDDYTPMEFVVEVLDLFFKMNREQATQIMLTVHTQGRGVCGIYTRDIAETKAAQATEMGRAEGYPLTFSTEPEE